MDLTSATLLGQLQRPETRAAAWERFVRLYSPLLFHWARRVGLPQADAADLVQDVFVTLLEKLPLFEYDRGGGFRKWLRAVTLNKWRDRGRRLVRQPVAVPELSDVPDDPDDSWFTEQEYRRALTERAMELIRQEFQPTTWAAFVGHGVNGRSASDVAAEVGLTVGAVYAARVRVLARLRQELAGFVD